MLAHAARSWVASPLGVNLLLSLFKDKKGNFQHFEMMCELLKKKIDCITMNKVFSTPSNSLIGLLEDPKDVVLSEYPRNTVSNWLKENFTEYKHVNLIKDVTPAASFILVNLSTFDSPWTTGSLDCGAMMTIYNSFSYTQDVNYEARILELPMQDRDFRLVLIAPNETDLLHTLFRRLVKRGLEAAICNIRPLFTVRSKLNAPSIQFQSERTFQQNTHQLGCVTISHYGKVNLNSQRAQMTVLTCLYPTSCILHPPQSEIATETVTPFYFALAFQDTPLFAGQFNYKENDKKPARILLK